MKTTIAVIMFLFCINLYAQQEDSIRFSKKKTNSKKVMIAGILTTAGGLIITGIGTSMMNNPNTNDNKSFPVLMTGLMTVPVGAILTGVGGFRVLHFKQKLKRLNMQVGLASVQNFETRSNRQHHDTPLILKLSFRIP